MAYDYNLDEIFSLESVDDGQVIIKVHADNPLKVAQFPFVTGEYAYITVTRGHSHLMKIVKKDSSSLSFHWGESGHTVLSGEHQELKKQVLNFIDQNDILLDWDGTPLKGAFIFFNHNYNKWQMTLLPAGTVYYLSKTATSEKEMEEDVKRFVLVEEWIRAKENSGFSTWEAQNPKFIFK